MAHRTVEDRLREEYFKLSPEIKRVLHQLQTEVAHLLLPFTLDLKHHERIHIAPTFQILLQYESWFFQSHDWSGSTQHCVLNTLTGPQTLSEPENHQNSAPGNIMATVPRVQ